MFLKGNKKVLKVSLVGSIVVAVVGVLIMAIGYLVPGALVAGGATYSAWVDYRELKRTEGKKQ